jgi:hypothetical protein
MSDRLEVNHKESKTQLNKQGNGSGNSDYDEIIKKLQEDLEKLQRHTDKQLQNHQYQLDDKATK